METIYTDLAMKNFATKIAKERKVGKKETSHEVHKGAQSRKVGRLATKSAKKRKVGIKKKTLL
jgi:hypothetical protein